MIQKITTVLALLLLLAAVAVSADSNGNSQAADNEVEQGREMIREGRMELVRANLNLTEVEESVFWPLYTAYRGEIDAIQDRYAAMISDYLRRYDEADLSNEYADELIETFLGIKRELLDVQEEYLPEFRGVLPSLKVARLYQLENKINAEIDAELALVVPLVDPT